MNRTMQLSAHQIRQAMCHVDRDVRDAAVAYLVESSIIDQAVMPTVVEAVERYGWQEAFSPEKFPTELPQSEDTLRWCLEELQREEQVNLTRWMNYCEALSVLIANADVELLREHTEAITTSQGLDRRVAEMLQQRLEKEPADAEQA